MASEDRFVFNAEWYDQQAALTRQFLFEFYLSDKTIDIYDVRNKRIFLKRCRYPSIDTAEGNLYIGATVTVYSRQFKIVDYADDFTKKAFTGIK
jgi:nucleoside-diphosphate kinase